MGIIDDLRPKSMRRIFNLWNLLEDGHNLLNGKQTLNQIISSYKSHHEQCGVVVTHVKRGKK